MHAYMHACIHACMHTYIHTCIQATAIAKKWRLAHDQLAESLHQLLLVLESRVQPEALRTGKDGKEGAAITAVRKADILKSQCPDTLTI